MAFYLLIMVWRLTSIAFTAYAHHILEGLGDGHCVMSGKSTKLVEVEDGFQDHSCYLKRLDHLSPLQTRGSECKN